MKVFVFPGQGTQRAGMLRQLRESYDAVKDIFDTASELSGIDMQDLCTNQNDDVLAITSNTQLAVTAMNLSYLRLLEREGVEPDVVMGQSVGQFSALAACGALSIEDVFRLLIVRSRLMDSIKEETCLYAVLGLSPEKVKEVLDTMEPAADGKRVEIGLINSDKQAVIGGRIPDLDKAAALMQQAGAYAVKKARLNHAFHTSYLEDMVDEFTAFVETLEVKDPACGIILNCSAEYAKSAADIVRDIELQCCHTVLWRDSLKRLFEQKDLKIAEVGNGHTMQGILREAGFRDKVYLMSNPKELQMYVNLVKQ